MAEPDDKGPMQGPRTTSDVMKSAPAQPPAGTTADDSPEPGATDAATGPVQTGQEDA